MEAKTAKRAPTRPPRARRARKYLEEPGQAAWTHTHAHVCMLTYGRESREKLF